MIKARLLALLESLRILRFYVPHVAALGAAIAVGLVAGLTTIMGTPPAVDAADRWSLPRWAPYVSGSKRQEMIQTPLWLDDPSRKKEEVVAAVVPPWRFIGTVKDGAKLLAVIELDKGRRVQRLNQGEALPNGAPIDRISSGEISYTENNAETTLKLFGVSKDQNFPSPGKKN
ncbi:MAG: hypothetical protein K1X51_00960 [Rhodospirillaceae bacterium]|nr:hypothetical protein [Rhodospirillaceae bacterium]